RRGVVHRPVRMAVPERVRSLGRHPRRPRVPRTARDRLLLAVRPPGLELERAPYALGSRRAHRLDPGPERLNEPFGSTPAAVASIEWWFHRGASLGPGHGSPARP